LLDGLIPQVGNAVRFEPVFVKIKLEMTPPHAEH
jgi:hypothetical protein